MFNDDVLRRLLASTRRGADDTDPLASQRHRWNSTKNRTRSIGSTSCSISGSTTPGLSASSVNSHGGDCRIRYRSCPSRTTIRPQTPGFVQWAFLSPPGIDSSVNSGVRRYALTQCGRDFILRWQVYLRLSIACRIFTKLGQLIKALEHVHTVTALLLRPVILDTTLAILEPVGRRSDRVAPRSSSLSERRCLSISPTVRLPGRIIHQHYAHLARCRRSRDGGVVSAIRREARA